jgi:hypothetical protein
MLSESVVVWLKSIASYLASGEFLTLQKLSLAAGISSVQQSEPRGDASPSSAVSLLSKAWITNCLSANSKLSLKAIPTSVVRLPSTCHKSRFWGGGDSSRRSRHRCYHWSAGLRQDDESAATGCIISIPAPGAPCGEFSSGAGRVTGRSLTIAVWAVAGLPVPSVLGPSSVQPLGGLASRSKGYSAP